MIKVLYSVQHSYKAKESTKRFISNESYAHTIEQAVPISSWLNKSISTRYTLS